MVTRTPVVTKAQNQLVTPQAPCHDCHTLAPCVVSKLRPLHSGYNCSKCNAVRWSGVVSPAGARVLGLFGAHHAFVCWRCAEATTPPGKSIPELEYLHGPIGYIYSDDSSYKNDAHCDECGQIISPDR